MSIGGHSTSHGTAHTTVHTHSIHTTHVTHVHVIPHYHWYQPHYYYGSGGHMFLTIMLLFAVIGVAVWLVKR